MVGCVGLCVVVGLHVVCALIACVGSDPAIGLVLPVGLVGLMCVVGVVGWFHGVRAAELCCLVCLTRLVSQVGLLFTVFVERGCFG